MSTYGSLKGTSFWSTYIVFVSYCTEFTISGVSNRPLLVTSQTNVLKVLKALDQITLKNKYC